MTTGFRSPDQPQLPVISSQMLDDLASAEGVSGWEMRYLQISSGSTRARIQFLELDGVKLLRERFPEVTLNQCGHAGEGAILFGIPVALEGDALFNGASWRQGICLSRSEHEFNALVPPGEMISIAVPRSELISWLADTGQVDLEHWLAKGSVVLDDPRVAASVARRLCVMVDECLAGAAALGHAGIRRALVKELVEMLGCAASAALKTREPGFREMSRSTVVRRASRYARAHIDEPLQIADLCRAARVSRRTLQTSFQEILGVRPITWLHMLRLDGARRTLLNPADHLRVSDVLAQWGFWHMSRFSAEYRQLYGELPSQTLRRVRAMPSRPAAAGSHSG